MAQVLFVLIAAYCAGLIGSLLGLGGGVIAVPLLVLLFQLPVHNVVAATSIGTVATSIGSAAGYLRTGVANLRLALLYAIATMTGAICGALVSVHTNPRVLYGVFAAVLVYAAYSLARPARRSTVAASAPERLEPDPVPSPLSGLYRDVRLGKDVAYEPRHVPLGAVLSLGSGLLSGLLGIGGGVVNVPVLHVAVELPLRAAIATSVLMVGFSSTAAGIVQITHGNVVPDVAAAVALGMLLGGRSGAFVAPHIPQAALRWLFVVVLLFTAVQMLARAGGLAMPWEH